MKRIIVFLAVSLLLVPVFSQNVTIPDANFLAALIEEGVDTDEDGQISIAEAEAETELNVSSKSISDLMGIEAFVNLTLLDCCYNQLTSLDISKNTDLGQLRCEDNQLSSLDVSKNTDLYWLFCNYNQLTSLDVSNNTMLQSFECAGNQLSSLDVSNNIHLRDGYWSPGLDCSHNQLINLDVSKNTELETLNCSNNQLTSLDVSTNTALTELSCSNNQLTSLDVSTCSALTGLYCYGNQLTSLDVSNNIDLSSLSCSNNQLTNLDVSKNTKLDYLLFGTTDMFSHGNYDCICQDIENKGNRIGSIDLSNCPDLFFLDCSSNPLTSLDITNNTSIFQLCLCNMDSLSQVCVSTMPPEIDKLDTTSSPNIYFTTECTIGIDEANYKKLSIYPNPTNSPLTIETDQPDAYSIEIISLSGQLIYRTEMEGTSKQIDLSQFSKGIYFITVRSKEFVRTEKVVKY